MEPFTQHETLVGFLESFPPMPVAEVEAERASAEAKQLKRVLGKAQACRDEFLRDVPVIADRDNITAQRLAQKKSQISEFNNRVPLFEGATSFRDWAKRKSVKINGANVPVDLWNLTSYLGFVKTNRPLQLFKKCVEFAQIELTAGRITEIDYEELIQGFGSLCSPLFREVTTPELAQIYSVENEYDFYEEHIGKPFILKIRDEYWGPIVTTWVKKGWISEEKKEELFAEFDDVYIEEEPVVRVDDVAALFFVGPPLVSPRLPVIEDGISSLQLPQIDKFEKKSLKKRAVKPKAQGSVSSMSVRPSLKSELAKMTLPKGIGRGPIHCSPLASPALHPFLKRSSNSSEVTCSLLSRFCPPISTVSPLMERVSLSLPNVRTKVTLNVANGGSGAPTPPARTTARMHLEASPRTRRIASEAVTTTKVGMSPSPRIRGISERVLTSRAVKGSAKVSPSASSVTASFNGSPLARPY